MRTKILKAGFVVCLLLVSALSAHATKEAGNGGDTCEDHFKIIRDDIKAWVEKGGSSGLRLPHGISLAQYNDQMLDQISSAHVSCVDKTIKVAQAEKTCTNFVDGRGQSQIECNIDRFMNHTSASDQYVLVNHEYAGLAGFEENKGDDSQYFVSNQISEYLVDVVVKRLAIKSPPPPTAQDPGSCAAQGKVTQCESADGKYRLVFGDSPFFKEDFPTGVNSINLCTVDGVLKLNGQTMYSKDFSVVEEASSVNGLLVTAPDKSVFSVNALMRIFGPADNPFSIAGIPGVEGLEVLVSDQAKKRNVALYLLQNDGLNSSKIELTCGAPQ